MSELKTQDRRTTAEIITAYVKDETNAANVVAVKQRAVQLGMDLEREGFLSTNWHGKETPEEYVTALSGEKAFSLLFDLNASSEDNARPIGNMESF